MLLKMIEDELKEHCFDRRGNCACGKAKELKHPEERTKHVARAVYEVVFDDARRLLGG